MRLLIALVVWVAVVVGAVELSSVVSDSVHTSRTSGAAGSGAGAGSGTSGSGTGGSFDASSVKPTDPVSLFRPGNFARALALARGDLGAGARLDNFALYPGYMALIAVRSGSEADEYVDASGRHSLTDTGGNPLDTPLFSLARLTPDVPAALAHRIAAAAHVPESQLHYMVADVDPSTHQLRWLVFPRQGNRVEYFEASGASGPLFELPANSSSGPRRVRG